MKLTNKRLTPREALELFEIKDLIKLGIFADEVRQNLHKQNIVTFVIDRNINYTNICSCRCKFCAFYRSSKDSDAYILDYETIKDKISELVKIGGTQVLLQGGLNPEIPLEYYLNMVKNIRKDFPSVTIHSFSPPEIVFISEQNKISIKELIQEMIKAGLSSIPGGGAEILSDSIRKKISPDKITSSQWLEVMETAHNLGLNTTATMVFGFGEKPEHIIEHLLKIRALQDKTGKFTAFIPWTFKSDRTELKKDVIETVYPYDYLKVLAVSRLVLDNIANIQSSWVTQGLKTAQLSLRFGANDFGGTMLEENVVRCAGTEFHKTSSEQIIKNIRQAGFIPAQRDTAYNIIRTFN